MRPGEAEQADQLESELRDEDRRLLDDLAAGIARRRLVTPAIFLLESVKPMNLLGSAALVMFRPIVAIVWNNPAKYDRVIKLLEHRGALEVLVRRLEAHA